MSAAGGGAADHSGYQVFLSFRGPDVKRGFLGHLYDALKSAGFNVFQDSYEINIGDDISAAIHHAIEQSRIFIIIFSCNFAESAWCLKEPALIVRDFRGMGNKPTPELHGGLHRKTRMKSLRTDGQPRIY